MVWTRRVAVAAVVVVVCGLVATPGWGEGPSQLRLKFTKVVDYAAFHCGNNVQTSHDYTVIAVVSGPSQSCSSSAGFLLVNDRTGAKRVLPLRGLADVIAYGFPWILFEHNLRGQLYNIQTRKYTWFSRLGGNLTIGYELGSDWLEYINESDQPCSDGHIGCGPDTYGYYNLITHKTRGTATRTSSTVIDLDTPALTRRLCAPVQVPAGGEFIKTFGRYNVMYGPTGTYLQKCGSSTQWPFGGGDFWSEKLVLSQAAPTPYQQTGEITGVRLPSMSQVNVTIPAMLGAGVTLAELDDYRIYLENAEGTVWSATIQSTN